MNAAIIIGVSKYQEVKNNLPACQADAEIINNIIVKTGKFDSILYINENETSSESKEQVINFISNLKGKKVEEFFFTSQGTVNLIIMNFIIYFRILIIKNVIKPLFKIKKLMT